MTYLWFYNNTCLWSWQQLLCIHCTFSLVCWLNSKIKRERGKKQTKKGKTMVKNILFSLLKKINFFIWNNDRVLAYIMNRIIQGCFEIQSWYSCFVINILLVCFSLSWDINLTLADKFHVSVHPVLFSLYISWMNAGSKASSDHWKTGGFSF